ncbi:hypothetical protein COY95_00570, partial [Candidatus Woesearchaeota archaeon CG_4_10_14_0_8_um_filter_47_5]
SSFTAPLWLGPLLLVYETKINSLAAGTLAWKEHYGAHPEGLRDPAYLPPDLQHGLIAEMDSYQHRDASRRQPLPLEEHMRRDINQIIKPPEM